MNRILLAAASILALGIGTARAQLTISVPNAASTGTTLNALAKLTGAPSTAVKAATTDTFVEGIVYSGAGTTGNALIARAGEASCIFDGATTAGDYVQISTGTAGDCTDAGSTLPTSGQILGRVLSTNGSGGTYPMTVQAGTLGAGGSGGSGTVNSGTSGQMTYYGSTGTAVSGNADATIAGGGLTLGVNGTAAGSLFLKGGTSGASQISVPTAAGTGTAFKLPANNGTSGNFLQTDGSGNTSWQAASGGGGLTNTSVSTNTSATCGNSYIITAAATIALPLTTSQTAACQISVKNETVNTGTAAVVIAINGSDAIGTGSAGVGQTLLPGQSSWFGTNAAGNWYRIGSQAACIVYTDLSGAVSATVPITATRALYIAFGGQGGPGGNGTSSTTASQVVTAGGGGGPGQYKEVWFTGSDLATLGTSQTLTIPAIATPGNDGVASTFGSILTAWAGGHAANGNVVPSAAAGGGSAGLLSGGSGGTAGAPGGVVHDASGTGWTGIGAGGISSSATGSAGLALTNIHAGGLNAAAAGSSGGGITSGDVHSIGGVGAPSEYATGGANGAVAGGGGGDASNWNTAPYFPGASGGGGGSANDTDAVNGGNAGHSGWFAGGSGGGACHSGTSCTGGNGANGGAAFAKICQW